MMNRVPGSLFDSMVLGEVRSIRLSAAPPTKSERQYNQ